MRDIETVLTPIISMVDDEVLIERLKGVLHKSAFTASELMKERWSEAQSILVDYFFDGNCKYIKPSKVNLGVAVFKIFTGNSENYIRENCVSNKSFQSDLGDAIHDIYYNISNEEPSDLEIERVINRIPDTIMCIGEKWGYRDTVFIEEIHKIVVKYLGKGDVYTDS